MLIENYVNESPHNPKVVGSNPTRATNRYGAFPVSKRPLTVGVLLSGPNLAHLWPKFGPRNF